LAPDGAAMVVFSEDADRDKILSFFTEAQMVRVDERIAYRWFERFHVLFFRRSTLLETSTGQEAMARPVPPARTGAR
jgi:hypothetical protein